MTMSIVIVEKNTNILYFAMAPEYILNQNYDLAVLV
jgi:hypothetical protein